MTTNAQRLEAEENLGQSFDANDPDQVNKKRVEAGRKKKAERETLAELMKYSNGRELLYNSIYPYLFGNPLVPGDPYSTYYNLGQEQRSRELFKEIIRVSPDDFTKMMEENFD